MESQQYLRLRQRGVRCGPVGTSSVGLAGFRCRELFSLAPADL